mgnify:CR=1 FL=1
MKRMVYKSHLTNQHSYNNQQNTNNSWNRKIWKKVSWKAQDQICFKAATKREIS